MYRCTGVQEYRCTELVIPDILKAVRADHTEADDEDISVGVGDGSQPVCVCVFNPTHQQYQHLHWVHKY